MMLKRPMMRKYNVIILLFIILFFISFTKMHNYEDAELIIEKINIEDASELIKEYEEYTGTILPEKILHNISDYKVVKLHYTIKNNSEKIRIDDVRCYPLFSNELKHNKIYYNDGGNMYIYIDPTKSGGFVQYIFIESKGEQRKTIYNKILSEKIKVTFYEDGINSFFCYNTGKGLKGIGKYTCKYKIKDCLNN